MRGERVRTQGGRILRKDWKITFYGGKWVPTTAPDGEGEWMDILTARRICRERNERGELPEELQDEVEEHILACHYCGLPAVDFGFFDEPICEDCGGRRF